MKIFIRADGGKLIGLGHIMRMIVLGKELVKNNDVVFICRDSDNGKYRAGIEKLKENRFEIITIGEENCVEDIVKIQRQYHFDMLITDSYDVNNEYFRKLKKYFVLTGYVDDVNKFKMDVDFVINQNIDTSSMDYSKTTSKTTKLLLGTKYCMIREEFRKASNEKIVKNQVSDILLTLGGMDAMNNTKKIIDIIKIYNKNIHVVLGSAFDKQLINDIYELSKKYSNIHPYENSNMSELMKICDIAITACGSTTYEVCSMRIPSIGLIIADNQEGIAKSMKKKNLLKDVFYIDKLNEVELCASINKLITNENIRRSIIENQRNIVNVNGAIELAKEIEALANKKQ